MDQLLAIGQGAKSEKGERLGQHLQSVKGKEGCEPWGSERKPVDIVLVRVIGDLEPDIEVDPERLQSTANDTKLLRSKGDIGDNVFEFGVLGGVQDIGDELINRYGTC